MKTITPIAIATTMLLGFTLDANAVTTMSLNGTGSAGNCQAALPVYDGLIRKRPLAVINEGTSGAFVTCAYTTEEYSVGVKSFNAYLTNLSSVSVTVNCTGVVGEESATAVYYPNSVTLAPGATDVIQWTDTVNNGGNLFARSVAISCNLPPLVGLNRNRILSVISVI